MPHLRVARSGTRFASAMIGGAMRAYISGLVACGLLLLCGTASAADYGDNLGEPNTLFGGGTTRYDATSGRFSIEATPRSTRLTPGAPRVAIEPPSSLAIDARIDAGSGTVLSGTFRMTGEIDAYGRGGQVEYSGTLLTGDIIEFTYFDLSSTDVFVFRFRVTGGSLAPRYAGGEIGVAVTVDQSTFTGSFDRSFKGGASGHVGISVPGELRRHPDPGWPHDLVQQRSQGEWSQVGAGHHPVPGRDDPVCRRPDQRPGTRRRGDVLTHRNDGVDDLHRDVGHDGSVRPTGEHVLHGCRVPGDDRSAGRHQEPHVVGQDHLRRSGCGGAVA